MGNTYAILLLLIGFIMLIKSADWLVSGASALARRYSVSELAIGLTIVAFGTSAPELVVNVFASAQNHQEMVYGNILGSNIFNLFIILGIAGLITPLSVQSGTVWKEIPVSLLAVIVLFILSNDFFAGPPHHLSRADGLILLILFCGFLYYVFRQLRTRSKAMHPGEIHLSTLKILGLIAIGLSGLLIGGKLIVNNATTLAQVFGISEKIIGLTIVAVGTSLPELATSVVAAIKKNNDIAIGNIIGSNIFNILFILGISSIVRPIGYMQSFNTEIYLLAGGTCLLFLAMFTSGKKKLDRWEAGLLVIIYLVYFFYLAGVFPRLGLFFFHWV